MSLLLAAATLGVVGYCLLRALGVLPSDHHRDLDLWHVVMGALMVVMLVHPLPRPVAQATLVLAAVALMWSTLRLVRRARPGPWLRLGLGWLAMTAMVLPVAGPASAATQGVHEPAGHHHAAAAGSSLGVPGYLTALLLAALVAVMVLRLWALVRPEGSGHRGEACCDVVMAAAMAAMLV